MSAHYAFHPFPSDKPGTYRQTSGRLAPAYQMPGMTTCYYQTRGGSWRKARCADRFTPTD